MKRTSIWGGYGASFFSIACFGEVMAYAVTQGELPDWFGLFTASTFMLATLSGVVCLSTALIARFRTAQANRPPAPDSEVSERAA